MRVTVESSKTTALYSRFLFLSRRKTQSDLPFKRITLAALWRINQTIGGDGGSVEDMTPDLSKFMVYWRRRTGDREAQPVLSSFYSGHCKQWSFLIVILLISGLSGVQGSANSHPLSQSVFLLSHFPWNVLLFLWEQSTFLDMIYSSNLFCFCDFYNPTEDHFKNVLVPHMPNLRVYLNLPIKICINPPPQSKKRRKKDQEHFLRIFSVPGTVLSDSFIYIYNLI